MSPGSDHSPSLEALLYSVIGGFFKVYNALGFGFLERVYASALEYELRKRGHKVDREVLVRVYYDGVAINWQRVDMVVEKVLVLENKATRVLRSDDGDQLLNYLKATRLEVGLLLHYGPEPHFYRYTSINQES